METPTKYPQPLSFLDIPGVSELIPTRPTTPGTLEIKAAVEKYSTLTGLTAPEFDATRPPQYWYSPTSQPNLPRPRTVAPYTVKPSGVHVHDGNTNPTVNPLYLSTFNQAVELISAAMKAFPKLKLTLHLDIRSDDGFPYTMDVGEDRNLWMINDSLVGHLLKERYDAGPGATLVPVGDAGFTWQPNPPDLTNLLAPALVPRREPHPDEEIRNDGLTGELMVFQKITGGSTNDPGVSAGEGQILAMLRDIDTRLKAKGI